jgi:hypothetical protein
VPFVPTAIRGLALSCAFETLPEEVQQFVRCAKAQLSPAIDFLDPAIQSRTRIGVGSELQNERSPNH